MWLHEDVVVLVVHPDEGIIVQTINGSINSPERLRVQNGV